MAYIKNPLSGGGGGGDFSVVNGVIEQYKAKSGIIDVGTFVEFVNSGNTPEVGAEAELAGARLGIECSAVGIDSKTAMLVYSDFSNNGYVYGVLCTINADYTISTGTAVALATRNNCTRINAAKVGNYVFIYYYSSGGYGIVCGVDGGTITVMYSSSVVDLYNEAPEIVVLNNYSAVVIGTANTSTKYGYVVPICFIEQRFTLAGAYMLTEARYVSISATKLDNGFVLVTHCAGGDNNLYGIILYLSPGLEVAQGYVSVGTDNTLATVTTNYSVDIASAMLTGLEEYLMTALVVYGYGAGGLPRAIVCTIDVSNSSYGITAGSYQSIGNVSSPWKIHSGFVDKIDDNNVALVLESSTANSLYYMLCSISGTSVSVDSYLEIPTTAGYGWYSYVAKLTGSSYFICSRNSGSGSSSNPYPIYGRFADATSISPSVNSIQGLTATACSSTTAGNVWLLNTNESE